MAPPAVFTPCYGMHSSSITQIGADLPCGVPNSTSSYVACCVNGDYCMSDSLCKYIRSDGTQGYYNADCTDPTLQDPACGATRCGAIRPPLKPTRMKLTEVRRRPRHSDLVYNDTTSYWACCWNSETQKIDCDNPSNEVYPIPAPSKLATTQYLPKTESGTPTYTTATATATTTTIASPSATTTGNNNGSAESSTGVSAGAAAGIGIGVGAAVVIIAAAALFVFFRRRTSKHGSSIPSGGYSGSRADQQVDQTNSPFLRKDGMPPHELDNNPLGLPELDTRK